MATAVTVDKDRKYQSEVNDHSKRIMTEYYDQLARAAKGGEPSGFLMISGNCVEILRAFDMHPVFPEVNALQLAIRKQSLPMILKAEQMGYSSDNCAYVKADVGMLMSGGYGPQGTIPYPSLVVCNYVGCNVYVKWFEHIAEFCKAPLYLLDIPFLREGDAPGQDDITYVVRQLEELIATCSRITGKPFDIDKLREVLALSARAEDGWSRAKELCKVKPAPFDAYFDSINMMGPINVLRGTTQAAGFFAFAVEAFEALAAQHKGPLAEERFRTVVEGPPPYPYYRNFRNLFSAWGAVAVNSTYSTVGGLWEWGFRHDPRRPLESIAEQMLVENLTNRSLTARYQQIRRYVEEWEADALVIHSIKSCRLCSAGQGDMREYFTRELGVPTLLVESDLEDPRYSSEAQMKNRIDAFFESLEHRKFLRKGTGGDA
ncbi:MAG: 2-hydroxyacyl-CoA dehydratase [candidate division NC10 bacterium]|nr:2-hydroxyacyl-CoA dehydratase [candidate division NC10 bacterium]